MTAPYSSGLQYFLSLGTTGDRPGSLNLHPTLLGIRYETDAGLFVWDGSDYIQLVGATGAVTTLEGLSDVVIDTSLAADDVLRFNGTNWVNSTAPSTSPGGSSGDIQTNNGGGGFGAITPASGIATFLATPSSANLRAALTDEVGTGLAYFVGGALGTPASGVATNLTSIPVAQATGVLPAVNGGAGAVSGVLKANGSGTVSAAASGTDYAPATSGSAILKGNGSGGFSSASAGTDYAAAPSGSANTPLFNNGSGGFTNGTRSGNTTAVATVSGSLTNGNVAAFDASGNIVDGGATPGSGGGFNPVTKTADYTVLSGDSGTSFNNIGAGGDIVLTLPAAASGLRVSAAIFAAHYIKFLTDGTDTISIGTDTSSAGGYVRSTSAYSSIQIEAHGTGKWITSAREGVWSIDA